MVVDSQGSLRPIAGRAGRHVRLDAFLAAFIRQDAEAEARYDHFPHFRLANDQMSGMVRPDCRNRHVDERYPTKRCGSPAGTTVPGLGVGSFIFIGFESTR